MENADRHLFCMGWHVSYALYEFCHPSIVFSLTFLHGNLSHILFFCSRLFAAGSRSWTVVLGSLQAKATKWLLYWSASRQRNDCFTGQSPGQGRGGGQIQAMRIIYHLTQPLVKKQLFSRRDQMRIKKHGLENSGQTNYHHLVQVPICLQSLRMVSAHGYTG